MPRRTAYEYLGIEVDEALGWQWQRDGASPNLAANVYEALVFPYLDYCSEVWACICKIQCDRLHRVQNKAGRRTFVILTQDLLIYFTTYDGTTLRKGDARSRSQISVFNSE